MSQNPERFGAWFTETSILLVNISIVGLSVMPACSFNLGGSYLYNHLHGCEIVSTPPFHSGQISVCWSLCYFGPFSISYTRYMGLKQMRNALLYVNISFVLPREYKHILKLNISVRPLQVFFKSSSQLKKEKCVETEYSKVTLVWENSISCQPSRHNHLSHCWALRQVNIFIFKN